MGILFSFSFCFPVYFTNNVWSQERDQDDLSKVSIERGELRSVYFLARPFSSPYVLPFVSECLFPIHIALNPFF